MVCWVRVMGVKGVGGRRGWGGGGCSMLLDSFQETSAKKKKRQQHTYFLLLICCGRGEGGGYGLILRMVWPDLGLSKSTGFGREFNDALHFVSDIYVFSNNCITLQLCLNVFMHIIHNLLVNIHRPMQNL